MRGRDLDRDRSPAHEGTAEGAGGCSQWTVQNMDQQLRIPSALGSKDLVNYQSGYQGLGVIVMVFVVFFIVACWQLSCDHRVLEQFDHAMAVK
jgi:hypothetical protein